MINTDEYKAALKRGEKEVSSAKAAGTSPYLPILDDLTDGEKLSKRVNLGLITIPLDKVVGTVNANRGNAFSCGFMPLLEPGSEFANKWCALFDSMVEEGMRDSIIAFEYLNKYYVREGNKRVSVSKYMNMVEIEGTVTRIIPEKTDDPEILLYYEFLDFYEKSNINYIYFSKQGYFKKFSELVGAGDGEWSEDLRMDIRSLFTRFSKVYGNTADKKLSVSDAFLEYIKLLHFEDVKDHTNSEIAEDIKLLKGELKLAENEHQVALSIAPAETKTNILDKIKAPKKLKIAFVYLKDVKTSAWCYAHELGRQYVEETVFPNEVDTYAYYNVSAEKAEEVLEELCKDNYDIIFDTAPEHNSACARMAVIYPDVRILNCSLNASTNHLRTYYLRTYESKYLIGMLAGAMTDTNHIAYVADYPVYGSVASINAFAMGAKAVNPKAEVYLTWTCLKDSTPQEYIVNNNCDLVSDIDWSSPRHITKHFGLYIKGEEGPINLAAPLWDWGKLYEELILSVRRGAFKGEQSSSGTQSISYWWGLSSGAVDVVYSSHKVPALTYTLMEHMKKQIANYEFNPFSGSLYFQNMERQEFPDGMPISDLVKMDVLYENVHGFIPGVNDVKDELIDLTKAQGIMEDDE